MPLSNLLKPKIQPKLTRIVNLLIVHNLETRTNNKKGMHTLNTRNLQTKVSTRRLLDFVIPSPSWKDNFVALI